MDRNQAWPGETSSRLASTSTHELFGSTSASSSAAGAGGGHEYQQQHQYQQQLYPAYQTPHPYQHEHQYASEMGAKKAARRNRNALSCAECRRLKLKCSRVWPCTSCVKRKCAHICPDDVLKEVRPSRTKEVGALQNRIRELEQSLAAKNGAIPSQGREPSASGGHRTRPQSPTNASSSIQDEGSYQSYEPYNASGTAGGDSHAPGIQDVAEVMGTLLLGDDGSSRYLGKSAANALFHEDGSDDGEGSAGSQDDEDDIASTFSGRFQPGGFPMVSRGLDVEDFQGMLPPLPDAQRLAHAYYTNCAYMFEPLRRDAFDKYLSSAYNFNVQDPLPLEQLACVFIVMALGVSFDLEAEFRDPASNKYHNIAQACLTNAKFLNVPSLASIQCLHLMSTWQLTTHSQTGAFRAWPLLGLAGRMVLSTGIHRDGSIWAIPDPHLTIRRQLFWELASYDRFQGLILGRPYMLNSKHFDTLMPEGGSADSGESIEYHRAKWQFSLLVGELCDECLSVGRPGYDTILLHDRKIRTFKENLPAWLRFDPQAELAQAPPEPGSREFRQMAQRHALVVMIHETLLFLHRVAFANAIENYPAEPLRSPWAQSVVSLCLEAARTLIGVTRSAFHSYPKLAARWWHIQIHCFGAATCLAAVCIKAPASALTRLAWAELCDAVNLLENQIPEGGHARDLAPRLKRLREQAQLKLDAYQQSIISSNYPSVNANYDGENRSPHHQHGSQSANIGDSPPEDKANAAGEDDKLAVLGTATRVLEGKLRQSSRHHNNSHKQLMGGSKSTGGSSYNSATPPGVNGVGSASLTSYSSFTNSYSPSFGSLQQGQLQQQQQQASMSTGSSTGLPVHNASTPTAQSQPFAMGKGAMPVNIGYVDQSLADMLAEVSTPGRDPALTSAAGVEGTDNDEDDSGMMYFNMPSGSTPGATSPSASGVNREGEGNAFSSFSFTTQDSFKAPRNPSSSATSPTANTSGKSTSTTSSSTNIPSGSVSQSSTASSSNYTALPDAGVSPSSGLNFGQSDMGLSENDVVSPTGNGSGVASGSSFLSSIPGLLAPSPGGTSPYGSYATSSASDGRRGSMQDSMLDGISQQQQTSQQSQAPMRTSQNGQSQRQYSNAVNNGGNPEDSYLDTAWMDYFPTPGVGLFPQSTGLLFGGSSGTSTPGGGPVLATSQMVAPPQQQQQQPQMMSGNTVGPQGQGGQRGSISFSDGAGNIYPITHPGQPRQQQQQGMQPYHSPPHQLPHPHQQQQQMHQQQQRGRYMPQQAGPPGAGNMNTYRAYDDLFGSGNNRY